MKILIYETRADELEAIHKLGKELPIEIQTTSEIPSMENVSMAEGCDGISILGQGRIATGFPFWDRAGLMGPFWMPWPGLTSTIFLPEPLDTITLIWNMRRNWASMYAMPVTLPMVLQTLPL